MRNTVPDILFYDFDLPHVNPQLEMQQAETAEIEL